MATAGSIVIDLLMKTGAFETDSKRAEKRLKEMEATAKKWGATIATATVAAGAAFAGWTVKMAEQGKELDRLSRLANTSAETFQGLAYGAQTVGIENEKLADILKDVQDRVGDFITTGGGPMKDFFEQIAPKIGVTAEQFRNLSGSDALQLFFQSLEKANLSQSEMIFYMEAMAGDASLLIPLLRNNSAEFNRLTKEARDLGAVMSNETVAAAREMDRNLDRLSAMVKGVSVQFANSLLPTMSAFVGNAITAATKTDDLRDAASELAGDKALPDWIKATGAGLARLIDVAVGLAKALNVAQLSVRSVASDVELWIAESAVDKSGISDLINPDAAKKQRDELAKMEAQRDALVERANKALSDLWNYKGDAFYQAWNDAVNAPMMPPTTVYGDSPGGRGGRGGGGGGSKKTQLDEGQRLIDQMNERIALIGKETEYEKLLAQIAVGSITFRTQAQQDEALAQAQVLDFLAEQKKAYEDNQLRLQKLTKAAQDSTDRMNEFGLEAARNIQDAFGSTFYSAITGSFEGIGLSFAQMLARMGSELAASELARFLLGDYGKTGSVGGLLGNLVGDGLQFMFGGKAGVALGSTAGMSGAWGRVFSDGGYTGAGGKYDVAGVVHAGEYVINADATRRLGLDYLGRLNAYAGGGYVGSTPPLAQTSGTGSINITVNVNGDQADVTTSGDRANQFGLELAEAVRQTVQAELARSHRQGGILWQQRNGQF